MDLTMYSFVFHANVFFLFKKNNIFSLLFKEQLSMKLTEWTLDNDNRWYLKRFTNAILILCRNPEVISSTLNEVWNTTYGSWDS